MMCSWVSRRHELCGLWDVQVAKDAIRVFMGIETARTVREGLAELIRLVNDADTSTAAARRVLEDSKAFGAQVAVLQADAAALVAKRDRHGDGGVGVLAQAAGLSKRDAVSQVKTVEALQSMPSARGAMESGEISVANARTLATACERTSAEQVEQDGGLLAQAATLSPEQFTREAGRWAAKRQEDDGEERYRRQRARRRLSFWDGDDGMVHLRGELDPVTGAKVRKRFVQEAERLRRADLHSPGGDKRRLTQRTADALDTLTSHGSIYSKAESAASRGQSHDSASNGDVQGRSRTADGDGAGMGGTRAGVGRCGCGGQPLADITIVQHLSSDGIDAFAEVAGGGVIPQSVLEEYFCDARITGAVFSSEGVPLWHGHTKRLATKAQMNALRARYGACGGCGADMWVCLGHHVEAVSQGGATDIDNTRCWCAGPATRRSTATAGVKYPTDEASTPSCHPSGSATALPTPPTHPQPTSHAGVMRRSAPARRQNTNHAGVVRHSAVTRMRSSGRHRPPPSRLNRNGLELGRPSHCSPPPSRHLPRHNPHAQRGWRVGLVT